eukprot:4039987-Pyramimonas_sp.AAC.1
MDALAEVAEEMKAWYDKRSSDFEIFCPGTQAWHQWTSMDVTVIRSAALAWDQGKEDEELKGDEEVTKPFWCDCVVTDDQGQSR